MSQYNPEAIEDKWQKYWMKNRSFVAEQESNKPKYYVLCMFPYPSGSGLHVGKGKLRHVCRIIISGHSGYFSSYTSRGWLT